MSEKSAFIYLFAPPNNYLHTRAKDGHLQNVINYVNVEDAVPKVSTISYGYFD